MRRIDRAIMEIESLRNMVVPVMFTQGPRGAAFIGCLNSALFCLAQAKALGLKHPELEPQTSLVDELIYEVNRDLEDEERDAG